MRKSALRCVALLNVLVMGATFGAEKSVVLDVDNMTCPTCAPVVQKSLTRIEGVIHAEVSMATHSATVTFDDAKTGVEALIRATTNAGYPSRLAQ